MNKTKFVINGKFLSRRITGAQRYAWEVVKELDKLCEQGEFVLALPKDAINVPTYNNIQSVYVGLHTGIVWEQIDFPIYAIKRGLKTLNLCNVAPLLSPGVSAIFDMKVKSYPQFFSKKFRMWYYLLFWNQTNRCDFIITDSYDAKSEILKYYPHMTPKKVLVAYCSWQHYQNTKFDENTLEKYGLIKGAFFFGMGSLEPNKNFKWIAEVAKRNIQTKFAIAGSLNSKVFANGMGFDCPENVKLLGFISDEEAKTLMRDCKGFLFPSICEGFGMPPLEALSAGCENIVVSDIPVMREIFENEAMYVDNMNYEYNMAQLNLKTADGQKILDKFSWEESAEKIYNRLKKN